MMVSLPRHKYKVYLPYRALSPALSNVHLVLRRRAGSLVRISADLFPCHSILSSFDTLTSCSAGGECHVRELRSRKNVSI